MGIEPISLSPGHEDASLFLNIQNICRFINDIEKQIKEFKKELSGTGAIEGTGTTGTYAMFTTPYRIGGRTFAQVASDIQASIDHGALLGLSDDDHTQYFLADGSRTLGGNVTYSPSPISILANTSDGSDSSGIQIGGGGAITSARGAYLRIYGNEQGVYPGQIILDAGDTGNIGFRTSGTGRWRITSQALQSIMVAGAITADTDDAADTHSVSISGGGAVASNRGAYITLYGDDAGASAGKMEITAGDSGHIRITGKTAIGANPLTNEHDLALLSTGILALKETTTPSADTGYGKVYTKSDNILYFQDRTGVEHSIVTNVSGTANYVPQFTDLATLANSPIYNNSGKIGIGLTTDAANLLHLYADNSTDLIQTGDKQQLIVQNAGAGDAVMGYEVGNGTQRYATGIDNSDADKWKVYNITGGWTAMEVPTGSSAAVNFPGVYLSIGTNQTWGQSVVHVEKAGSSGAIQTMLELYNKTAGAAGTGSMIRFIAEGSWASVSSYGDAGYIKCVTEQQWLSGAGTDTSRDAFISIETVRDETLTEVMRCDSNGHVIVGQAKTVLTPQLSGEGDVQLLKDGVLVMKEGGTPTPDAGYGKLYWYNDDLYLQDGSGNEQLIGGASGFSGTFTNGDGHTVTVTDGIITSVA